VPTLIESRFVGGRRVLRRRFQFGRQEFEVFKQRGPFRVHQRERRARRREQAEIGRRDAPERQPRSFFRFVEFGELRFRFFLGDRQRAAAAVVEDQAGQFLGPGLAAEVPRGIRGHDRAAERVAAQDDLAAKLFGFFDHHVEIFHGDVHAPVLGELDARVFHRFVDLLLRGAAEVAEVEVEELFRGGFHFSGERIFLFHKLPQLVLVEHLLVLEEVLPAFHGPHLPAWNGFDQGLGERHEVRRRSRGPRLEHEHVGGCFVLWSDLDDPHRVQVDRLVDPRNRERRRSPRRSGRRLDCSRDLGLAHFHHGARRWRHRHGSQQQRDRDQRKPAEPAVRHMRVSLLEHPSVSVPSSLCSPFTRKHAADLLPCHVTPAVAPAQ
jgi:hypothetical protein